MADHSLPLKAISPSMVVFVAMGVALKEAVANGLLTSETLDAISRRGEDIAKAMAAGKVIEIDKDNRITIRDPDEEENRTLSGNPDFPLYNQSKKTLDV